MSKIDVLNWNKEKVGDLELRDEVFGRPMRKDILQAVVRWQLACRRSGTHSTKTKGLVRGGGKKPFKQKGTGNARQGSNRSPLMPGGGIIFGPQPRDYSYVLPKKVKQAGLKIALSYLYANNKLFVIDDINTDGKTKDLSQKLKSFGLKKAVLVDVGTGKGIEKAARNLESFRYLATDGLNVYDLLKYDAALVSKSSLESINLRCGVL